MSSPTLLLALALSLALALLPAPTLEYAMGAPDIACDRMNPGQLANCQKKWKILQN